MRNIGRRLVFVLAAAGLPVDSAAQQQSWPSRVVRIIATSPPGGAIDLLSRTIADEYAKAFGQPFIVENRPGANGNLGVELVLKAPPDGHMLFVTAPGPFSINLNLFDAMPFNPAADIAPVALLGVSPLVLVVHPSLPVRNLKELLAFMRSRPGRVNYASQAVGSTGHLAMELLKARAGVEATHVPYKGSAAAATIALLSGEAATSFVNSSASIPHIRSGRLRAIAVAEKKRIAAAPEIPTVDESSLPGFEATPWLGLGTRSGVAKDVVYRLSEVTARALARPDTVALTAGLGIEMRPMAPEQFAEFIRAETAKWSEIIKRSGAKAE